ncbi:MAG: tetratricopeptide repeat protein [Rhodospirillaceae bacterium]|nr:tetratricopeptide repeat protein [Rhodospirillales bacterium]
MSSWWKSGARRVVALALVSAVAASCTPHPGGGAANAPQREEQGPVRTALGAFLAGRLAQGRGDTRAAAEYYSAALKFDPDNMELLQRAFTLMVAEGRMDEASPLADRLLSFDGDAPIPLLVAGLKAAREGRFTDSETHFAALPKRGVFGFLGPMMTAWSRAGQGRTDAALEALAPLGQINGLAAMQAFHSGLINDLADRTKAAEDSYQVALATQLSIRSVEAAGTFFQRNGKPERAKDLYGRYRTEHPESVLFDGQRLLQAGVTVPRAVADSKAGMAEALFDMSSLMRQGNAVDLAMVFSRLTLAVQPDFALAQMNVADILSSQDRQAEANALYRAIDPASPVAVFGRLRSAMNLEEMGQTEAALAELDKFAKDQPDNLDALITKGDVLRRKKRFDEAALAYDGAIKRAGPLGGHHWALFYARGISFERSRDWPKAEADFLKALELKPDQPDVLNYLGYTWVDRGLNLDKARAMIEKAVSLRPKDGAIVDSLGWALYRLGEYQSAVKALERAIELRPEDPTINDHLGDAYFQVGRFAEATFQWKRALSLDPEPEQIEPVQKKIDSGRVPANPLAK